MANIERSTKISRVNAGAEHCVERSESEDYYCPVCHGVRDRGQSDDLEVAITALKKLRERASENFQGSDDMDSSWVYDITDDALTALKIS